MHEETKIREIINLYFKSMYEANSALVHQVFHPRALITGYVDDKLEEMDTDSFAKFVGDQKPSPSEKNDPKILEIISIKIVGKTAVALVRDDYLQMTYLDTLSFLKVDDKWLIYNKLFHVEN